MRYFEDFTPGEVITHPGITISEQEIVEFASRFDPQSFHTDPESAADSTFGGLIASGWHTGSITMRMLCDSYILDSASMGSPGIDEVRWRKPVRPGDTLSVRVKVEKTRRSRSKPDRGVVHMKTETLNQHGDVVMSFAGMGMYRCRTEPEPNNGD